MSQPEYRAEHIIAALDTAARRQLCGLLDLERIVSIPGPQPDLYDFLHTLISEDRTLAVDQLRFGDVRPHLHMLYEHGLARCAMQPDWKVGRNPIELMETMGVQPPVELAHTHAQWLQTHCGRTITADTPLTFVDGGSGDGSTLRTLQENYRTKDMVLPIGVAAEFLSDMRGALRSQLKPGMIDQPGVMTFIDVCSQSILQHRHDFPGAYDGVPENHYHMLRRAIDYDVFAQAAPDGSPYNITLSKKTPGDTSRHVRDMRVQDFIDIWHAGGSSLLIQDLFSDDLSAFVQDEARTEAPQDTSVYASNTLLGMFEHTRDFFPHHVGADIWYLARSTAHMTDEAYWPKMTTVLDLLHEGGLVFDDGGPRADSTGRDRSDIVRGIAHARPDVAGAWMISNKDGARTSVILQKAHPSGAVYGTADIRRILAPYYSAESFFTELSIAG